MAAKKKTGSKGTSTTAKKPEGSARKVAGTNGGAEDGEENRLGRRVPIQLLVDYKADGSYLFDFCKDLGAGGVFIHTNKPLAQGAPIDLTFTIPDSKETLTTKGTVIWVQEHVADRKDLTPGMGVQFAGFSTDQRRILDEFVQRYHGQRLASVTDTSVTTKSTKRAG